MIDITTTLRLSVAVAVISQAACSISMSPRDPAEGVAYTAPEIIEETSSEKTKADKNEPGMIHIQRHTPGYTISMVLDATDDNVHFVMDLPTEDKPDEQALPEEEPEAEQKKAEPQPQFEDGQKDVMEAGKHVLYAQTYFFEQKYNRALSEVNRALEYSPDSAVAYSLKGSIHFKRGERDQARNAWQKSLQLDPNQENVQQMLENL